jgi:hypothetical protein
MASGKEWKMLLVHRNTFRKTSTDTLHKALQSTTIHTINDFETDAAPPGHSESYLIMSCPLQPGN